jgi:hypothetical protein
MDERTYLVDVFRNAVVLEIRRTGRRFERAPDRAGSKNDVLTSRENGPSFVAKQELAAVAD